MGTPEDVEGNMMRLIYERSDWLYLVCAVVSIVSAVVIIVRMWLKE